MIRIFGYGAAALAALVGACVLCFRLDVIPAGWMRNTGAVGILALMLLGRMFAERTRKAMEGRRK